MNIKPEEEQNKQNVCDRDIGDTENPPSLSTHELQLHSNMSSEKEQDEFAGKTLREMPCLDHHMMTFSQMMASQMLGAKNMGQKLGLQGLPAPLTLSCVKAEAEMASRLTCQELLQKNKVWISRKRK